MREVQASDAQSQFCSLLKDVERGETIDISRDGEVIARVVPAGASLATRHRSPARQQEIERAIASIKAIRERSGRMTVEEILAARDQGRR